MQNLGKMEKIVSFCKRRGIVFPGSDIYGGLGNFWDFGPLGVEIKNNIKNLWRKKFVEERDDVVSIETSIIMNSKVWEASGHLKNFTDPLVECKSCHERFRQDILGTADEQGLKCPNCGTKEFTEPRMFNLLFKTFIGPVENEANTAYLRPENAQGMFVNFANILDTMRVKLPFGIAQIGKSFRNEITPGNFIFRTREFEIAEVEYFVKPEEDEKYFEEWLDFMENVLAQDFGLKKENLRRYEHSKDELAHYSKRTVDIQYKFPWGWDELWGLANRTDFDLKNHEKLSGRNLKYRDAETGKEFWPYVIEPTGGIERLMLAVLIDGYTEVKGGRTKTTKSAKEIEIVLKILPKLAPVKIAVLPLVKNKKEIISKTDEIAGILRKNFAIQSDEVGSIGRRYRRQDEIGTPYCVTIDFDTLKDDTVTVRDRDTMEQERIKIEDLVKYFRNKLI